MTITRGFIAAMVPLAFMAGATVGPTGASAAPTGSYWDPYAGRSFHPVNTFTPAAPAGCFVLSRAYAEQHAQHKPEIRGDSGAVVRELVILRLACGRGWRKATVVRRGPWYPAIVTVDPEVDPVVEPPAPPCDISCPEAP